MINGVGWAGRACEVVGAGRTAVGAPMEIFGRAAVASAEASYPSSVASRVVGQVRQVGRDGAWKLASDELFHGRGETSAVVDQKRREILQSLGEICSEIENVAADLPSLPVESSAVRERGARAQVMPPSVLRVGSVSSRGRGSWPLRERIVARSSRRKRRGIVFRRSINREAERNRSGGRGSALRSCR